MINKKIIFSTSPMTMDTTPPSIPTGIVTNDVTPNTVTWNASTDNVTPQNSIQYYVERADNSGFTINSTVVKNWTTGASGFDDVAPILVVGNTYYYRVKARDLALNESNWSGVHTSIIGDVNNMSIRDESYVSGIAACAGSGGTPEPMWHDGGVGLPIVGDFVYQNSGKTTPFTGGNLWWYDVDNNISYQILDTGEITGIEIC